MTRPAVPAAGNFGQLAWLLRLAAVVLFVIAAIIAFGAASFTTGEGLAFVGFACLAASFL